MRAESFLDSASSTGLPQSAGGWLSDHYLAAREPYEAFVARAAFPAGARILDAGCGAGDFLPKLRGAIGVMGDLVALDLDPENAIAARALQCAEVAVSSVLALPFRDGVFDGAWSANVTEYLDDTDLLVFLEELRRVIRPGGTVAVKDVDVSALTISLGDPLLAARLADACVTQPPVAVESRGSIRGRALGRWLTRAGFQTVEQTVVPIEYSAPLTPPAERLWVAWLTYLASLAATHDLPAGDHALWATVASPRDALAEVRRPEFYACELQVLATGIA